MDQHRATRCHTRAPVADVGAGRRIAVGAVDVEHGDGALHLGVGLVAECTHVTHAVPHSGALEVGVEALVVAGGLGGEAVDLLRATVVARVRVDGHHRHSLGCSVGEHHRAAALEAADLHHLVAWAGAGRGAEQSLGLVGAHPALHVGHLLQRSLQRAPTGQAGRLIPRVAHPT